MIIDNYYITRVIYIGGVSEMLFTYKLYNCDICFFHTNNKKDYDKHATTNKHNRACIYAAAAALTAEMTNASAAALASMTASASSASSSAKMRTPSSSSSSSSSSSLSSSSIVIAAANDASSSSPCESTEFADSASFLCLCGKHYKTQYGLRYHKRKCAILTPSVIMTLVQDNQELRKIIVAQNKLMIDHNHAFQQQIADLIPKMAVGASAAATTTTTINHNHHNTQNNFNLNIFLNEKCKDALNMSDFINSLKVTLDDLLITRERGLGESIGRILVQGLSTMDVYKRPIHCTDLKRDTMYVKDKEVWERDEQNAKIKGAIDQLSYKQIISIDDWKHDQPNIAIDDDLQLKYNTILLKVLSDTDEKDARKIIRCVSKETLLDKL